MSKLSIGDLARKSGLAVSAIRYYEEYGLLPAADRHSNNRRCYGPETLDALQFISACRKNGMGLSAIQSLQNKLAGSTDQCAEASAILSAVVSDLSSRIAELQAARLHLSKVASACCTDNCGPSGNACNIGTNLKATALA